MKTLKATIYLWMLIAVTGTLSVLANSEDSDSSQPNIIFILSDDQGYGDLGRHGNPVLKTPNLDQLYDQSVRFTNLHPWGSEQT